MKIVFTTLLILAGMVALLLTLGRRQWRAYTKVGRTKLDATRRPVEPSAFAACELYRLPVTVQRYLRTMLTEGQKSVAAVDPEQTGTINLSKTAHEWKPFTARQRVETRRLCETGNPRNLV